ncbi:aminotransferase class IV [Crateriforma conspicua]|uniref:aminotransferase class IV n=1 Tax=Crateriforma conspicua TaxID=2527996 RepID=UPI001189843A|nr:aminotransferase class IV [Crateriforma conspicua]QDV62888.1 D-alanine aminotransferase [Crateriforma conspicua]
MILGEYFQNGRWYDTPPPRIDSTDVGFRQGVTAVERLRTYHGQPFQTDRHLRRWWDTVEVLGIASLPSKDSFTALVDELIERNRATIDVHGDVGITWLATPGSEQGSPTCILQIQSLDHQRHQRWARSGQPLVITDVTQPPPTSWSRQIKTRCRLHYYLADQQAKRRQPDAAGVLLDGDGSITETSTCNLAILSQGTLCSPPKDRILHGVTQAVVECIAGDLGIGWTLAPITPQQLRNADEVLLMGTDAGVWFAGEVDGRQKTCDHDSVYSRIKAEFDRRVMPAD